jgi:N-acetylglutamate synthase-like GNAT family acetyltransferase
MSDIIIRAATISDVPELIPLLAQLDYSTTKEKFEKRFELFMSMNGYGIVIACKNDKVIGCVAWSKSELLVLDTSRFLIEALVVDEEYRGKNVGRQLMRYVEKVAQNASPVIISLLSGKRRAKDGTHEFYKKLGYANDGHTAQIYLRKGFDIDLL